MENNKGKLFGKEKARGISIYLILLILFVIVICYMTTAFEKIDTRNTEIYHINQTVSEASIAPLENKTFPFLIHYENVLSAHLSVNVPENAEGVATINIIDENGTTIKESSLQIADIRENGVTIDELDNLARNKVYYLAISSNANDTIGIYLNEDGNIDIQETYDISIFQTKMKTIIVLLTILFVVITIVINTNIKYDIKVLFLSLFIGTVGVIFVVPCSTPDEWRHFAKAYDIAFPTENGIFSEWGADNLGTTIEMPIDFENVAALGKDKTTEWYDEVNYDICISKWIDSFKNPNNSSATKTYVLSGTYTKSIICYWPQVIALWIAKLFGISAYGAFYLARFCNMIAALAIAFVAIRNTTLYKKTLTFFFLLPWISALRCVSSNDGLLFSWTLLLLSLVFKIRSSKSISYKDWVAFAFILSNIAIIKLPYVTLGLIIVVANWEDYNLKNLLRISVKVIAVLLIVFVIYKLDGILSYPKEMQIFLENTEIQQGPNASIEYMKATPFRAMKVLLIYFMENVVELFNSSISNGDVGAGLVALLSFLLMAEGEDDVKMGNAEKAIWALVILGLLFAPILAMYVLYVPVGTTVNGVQSRYMLPAFLCCAIVFETKIKKKDKSSDIWLAMLLTSNWIYYLNTIGNYW